MDEEWSPLPVLYLYHEMLLAVESLYRKVRLSGPGNLLVVCENLGTGCPWGHVCARGHSCGAISTRYDMLRRSPFV